MWKRHPVRSLKRKRCKYKETLLLLVGVSLVLGCIVGCGGPSASTSGAAESTDLARAREALQAFFSLLHDQRYSKAIPYYGGDYEILREWNPTVAIDDYATLFQNGCTMNGLQCLVIKTVLEEKEVSPGVYWFNVQFVQDDGSLFTRGPCCGATEAEMPMVSQFAYTVKKVDGKFLVQELPVYVS